MSHDEGMQVDIERCIVRFDDIEARRSGYEPFDMRLERFARARYAVVGRPAEGTTAGTPLSAPTSFTVVYLKCEPGKGVGMHAHATAEVFIPMSGSWRVVVEGGVTTTLRAWDVLSVPPNVMHGLENVSDGPAFVMAINQADASAGGAPIRFDPALIQELRERGEDVSEVEIPGGSGPLAVGRPA